MPVTQAGVNIPFYMGVGVGPDTSYTESSAFGNIGVGGAMAGASPAAAASGGPSTTASTAPKVSTLWYLLAAFVLIIAFKFAVEHEKSGMSFSFMGIGVYNFIAVGIMAFLFLVSFKVIFNKYYVPGLTELVNVV